MSETDEVWRVRLWNLLNARFPQDATVGAFGRMQFVVDIERVVTDAIAEERRLIREFVARQSARDDEYNGDALACFDAACAAIDAPRAPR